MSDSAATARQLPNESSLVQVVRERLRHNGDWNINDWKDVARALCDEIDRVKSGA